MNIPKALSIAGVDPGGGAGIIADIKTFAYFGIYGMGIPTALTSQNTFELNGIKKIDLKFFEKQLSTLLKDIKPDAIKTGMIPATYIVDVIYDYINIYKLKNLVIDPVMISKQNIVLSSKSVVNLILKKLVPLAKIVTPNIQEASYITGLDIKTEKDMVYAAVKLYDKGAECVLLKGGHLSGRECVDIFFDGKEVYYFRNSRINTKNTHGTGCTLSSAICANLSKGKDIFTSVKTSIEFVHKAIKYSFNIGRGNGPLNHMLQTKEGTKSHHLYHHFSCPL